MPLGALFDRLRRRPRALTRRKVRERTEAVSLGLARLEDRVVLDGAGLVTDLQPGSGSSNPTDLTLFNGSYYFAADGVNASGQNVGRELFRLDADGTVTLVSDINTGTAGSDPTGFRLFDQDGDARMLFAATGPQGRELYQIDTSGVVSIVFDVNPGPASSDPVMLTEFSGKLYFTAVTSATGREAYVMNNGGNVSLIADLNPGAASSNPSALFLFAGNLYFSAEVGGSRLLFREAPSGTSDPVLVNMGTGVTDPRDFVTFGDKLYFCALDPVDGRELFAMSVANNGDETVVKVANLNGTSASSTPEDFFVFGNNLYFSAIGANGRELFRLSASGAITQLDLNPDPDGSSPSGFVVFQGDMYFAATVAGTRGLWRLDTSTSALAAAPVPLPAGVTLPQEAVFYALANELFFAADSPAGRELFRMTPARVVTLAADINAGPASSNPAEVILFGGKVYFVATEAGVGRELFFLRRDPSSIRIDGNRLIFNDDAGDRDNRLVISSTGTHLVIVDQNGHSVAILTPITGAAGDGTSQVIIPLTSLTGITALDIFTRGGNDSATFDLSANANSLLAQFATSTFDGGANTAPGDKLRFVGDGVTSSVYTPDAEATGSGVVIVNSPTQTLTFSFLALEPVDFTGMAEAKLVTPATASGADVLTVAAGLDSLNGLLAALVVSGTVGGTTIETGHFFGNQSVVIVTSSGVDGSDGVTVLGAANAHGNSRLSIDTGPLGADSVEINGNVTLAGQLNVNTALLGIQAAVTLGGPATLATRGNTVFSSAGQLSASQVAITAGGAITMADGALVNAGTGTIALTAAGNITLGRLVTTNSTAAAISINSTGGSIIDGGDSGGANVVAEGLGAVVTITAAQSVGSGASPLDLAVRNLVVTSGGDQYLNELDDLSSLNLNAGSAAIQLTAGGQIQDADAAIDIAAASLVLAAASAGTVASPIQTSLTTLSAVAATGDLYLQESNGLTVLSATAGAAGGDLAITALAGSLVVHTIQASGLVTLVASAGAIQAGATGPNVTAASLEMQAATGIGTSATPLETAVVRLEAAGGTGGVFVANTGNLQVGGISPSLLGLTGISASGSDIGLVVTGNLTTVESIATSGAGAIDLSASGDLNVQAAITSQAGAIDLLAQRSLNITGTSITTTSGPITLVANPSAVPAAGAFNGITLTSATIGSTSGNITLQGQGGAGGGHGILLTTSSVGQNASGDVLLAGIGTLGQADIAWNTLTLAKTGGTFTFQDTVQGGQLAVMPGPYQVRFLDGGTITQAVNFQNTGGVVLGNQDSDAITFSGGLASTAGPTTIQGTIVTTGTDITLGATTLVSSVTLLTSNGDVTIGQISGAGVPLTINAVTGDVTLANPSNVIGNLTITAGALTLFENDNITQAGAWTTTGPTVLNSGTFAIVLTNPANQLGPLSLTGGSITVVESGDTELSSVTWSGLLSASASGNLLVSGAITGSGTAELSAAGNVTFAPAASIVSPTAASVNITAGGAINMADGALVNAGAGTIALAAAGNITLGRLVTTNSTAAAISINSTGGSVIDGGDSGGANVVAEGLGAVVSITAAQGVGGVASPLDLAVRNLVVTSGGDQYLNELDDLSSLNLNAGSAAIQLTAGGQILDADASIDIAAASLSLTAAGAGTPASPIQTALTSLSAVAATGDLNLQESNGLTVLSAAASAAGGDVGITTLAGNLVVHTIQASGLVTLVASAGAILAGAPGTNVTASSLEIQAATGIGTGATPLNTVVQKLEGAASSSPTPAICKSAASARRCSA
jgi:ELWxxDGT repeat protein